MTEDKQFKEAQEALIELIEWYRDEYHKRDFGHSEWIGKIRNLTKTSELEPYERMVDGWLD